MNIYSAFLFETHIFSCDMYSGLENILQSLPTWSSLSIVPPTTHTQIISFYFPFKK